MRVGTTAQRSVTPAAVFERVSKRYEDGSLALDRLSVEIGAGERVLVTGPPGSGVTTFLRVLSGRSTVTGGRARVLGIPIHLADQRAIRRLRSRVGMLERALHLPAECRVGEAMELAVTSADRHADSSTRTLERLGGPAPHRKAGDLDAVEQALLGLAMVAVRRPKLVVADDPWGNLDPGVGLAIGGLAARLFTEQKAAFVLAGRDAGAFDGLDRAIRLFGGRVVA